MGVGLGGGEGRGGGREGGVKAGVSRWIIGGSVVFFPEGKCYQTFNGSKKYLREDVSIHPTNLKYCGKSPKIFFVTYFHIL